MFTKNALKSAVNLFNNSKCPRNGARTCSLWTQDRTVKSPYKTVEIPNLTVNDYVWQNLDRWPHRTVSVCAVTGRGYTYEQAFNLSNAFAANLRLKFKIRDGDTVAIMLPNIPDFPLVALGILEAGGVISTINPVYTAHEVQRQVVMSQAKVIVTLPNLVNTIRDAFKMAKINIPIIVVKTNGDESTEGAALFNELSEDVHVDKTCLKEVRRQAKDICFLPYSSGTTGLPKGVELSHRNLVANCEQINEPFIRAHNDTTETHQDRVMAILPFFHIYGATVVMFHKISQGTKLVCMAKMQPDVYMKALVNYKINVLFAAPPLVLMMISHPQANPETYQHLEIVFSGAAPLAASDVERLLDKAKKNIDFRQGYGLTETSPVVAIPHRGCTNYGSVGKALPNTELRIVDENLQALGPRKTGELLVRGPQVMRGYRDNPAANAESFTLDGWYRTGDMATIDEAGVLTIADRLKELIKVKGFQVPPAELESVLREHPKIADAAVIGVPHETTGQAPKAFVVLKKGVQLQPQDVKNFVAEKVAPFKRLHEVVFLDYIPKSASGKILRKDLK